MGRYGLNTSLGPKRLTKAIQHNGTADTVVTNTIGCIEVIPVEESGEIL
jgi:hypothetical protein